MAENNPSKPVDLTEFTADVAARTGSRVGDISGRSDVPSDEFTQADFPEMPEVPANPENRAWDTARMVSEAHEKLLPIVGAWLDPDAESAGQSEPLEFRSEHNALHVAPSERLVADWVSHDGGLYHEKIKEGFDDFLLVPHLPFHEALAKYAELAERHMRRGELRFPSSVEVAEIDMAMATSAGLGQARVGRLPTPKLLMTEGLKKWSPLLVDRKEASGGGARLASRVLPRGASAHELRQALYGSPGSPGTPERFMSPVEYVAFLVLQLETTHRLLAPGSVVIFPDHTTSLDQKTAILCAERVNQKYLLTLASTGCTSLEVQRRLKQSGFAPRCVPIGLD